MLSAEQSHHLASEAASEKMGNHRAGSSPKTVLSPGGELQLRQRVYIGLAAQQYVFDGGDGGFADIKQWTVQYLLKFKAVFPACIKQCGL